MSPAAGFLVFLVVTLVLLASAVWTGFAHRRRAHLTLVVSAVAALGVTIYYAERLGQLYDLESAGAITPIHLFLAKLTTLAYLLPIASGIRLWFRPGGRALHRVLAFLVLGLTVVTAATGTAMVLLAEPKAALEDRAQRRGGSAPADASAAGDPGPSGSQQPPTAG